MQGKNLLQQLQRFSLPSIHKTLIKRFIKIDSKRSGSVHLSSFNLMKRSKGHPVLKNLPNVVLKK